VQIAQIGCLFASVGAVRCVRVAAGL
jgi:hypothetical protein